MTDLVIPLADRSDGEELRYTLRGLDKYVKDIGRLFIVGEKPGWLTSSTVIPCRDAYGKEEKEKNIVQKILLACGTVEISDYFLFSSDDVFTLEHFHAKYFPYFCAGKLTSSYGDRKDIDPYKQAVKNTAEALVGRGLKDHNFDTHTPMIFHKELFIKSMGEYDWSIKRGYVIKSLYCNTIGIEGAEFQPCKIHTPKTEAAIQRMIRGRKFFSTNEHSFNEEMKETLLRLYPEPSRWEV